MRHRYSIAVTCFGIAYLSSLVLARNNRQSSPSPGRQLDGDSDIDGSLYSENLKPVKIGQHNEITISSNVSDIDSQFETLRAVDTEISENGTKIQYHLNHDGASYISVHFKSIDLPDNCKIEIKESSGNYTESVLRRKGFHDLETFWARHVRGNSMTIVLFCDGTPVADSGAIFEIDRYVSGYNKDKISKAISSMESPSELKHIVNRRLRQQQKRRQMTICGEYDNENAICYAETHPTEYQRARAVARLYINGAYACTGWLVSHSPSLLLTNNHCIATQRDVDNTDFEFMGEEPTCETTSGNCMMCDRGVLFDGARMIKTSVAKDYTLVELEGNPALQYGILQIDNRPPVMGERIYIPQHPLGQAKEIGMTDTEAGGFCNIFGQKPSCSRQLYNDVAYKCDTSAGSSGAPVLSRNTHKVIALHHCGGGCDGNMAVPMALIYDEIEEFLNHNQAPSVQPAPSPSQSLGVTLPPVDTTHPITCSNGYHPFQLSLYTDKFPSETSWNLVHAEGSAKAGDLVFGGSKYPPVKLSTEDKCIPDDCYTFTIFDLYSDGICCSYGNGYYIVKYNGRVVGNGSKYEGSESSAFGTCGGESMGAPSSAPSAPSLETEPLKPIGFPSPTYSPTAAPSAQLTSEPSQKIHYEVLIRNGFEFPNRWGNFVKGGPHAGWIRGRIAHGGLGALALRGNYGSVSSIYVTNINLALFTSLRVDFYHLSLQFKKGDRFLLEYMPDDSGLWIELKTYVWRRHFRNVKWYHRSVTLETREYDKIGIRLRSDASVTRRKILIDDVTIMGMHS